MEPVAGFTGSTGRARRREAERAARLEAARSAGVPASEVRVEDGVTYLTETALARAVDVSHSMPNRWAQAGAIRATAKVRRGRVSRRWYSLADAVRLRLEDPEVSRARGVLRSPDSYREQGNAHLREVHARTRDVATQIGEHWTSEEMREVRAGYLRGDSVEAIALAIGRTYNGVACAAGKLREKGLIPGAGPADTSWLSGAANLLTDAEVEGLIAELLEGVDAAAE